MTLWCPLHESIRLEGVQTGEQNSQRIELVDAERQTATARAILERLHDQPGVVLADEVGMGKTFVALAVATSITLADARWRPAVVMVPSSLSEKWPGDFSYFAKRCLDPETAKRVRCRSASSGVELLKLLDDPVERRASIIFLTHGAMHRGLTDGWVKLAVIQRALFRRHHTQPIRKALARCAGELLRMQQFDNAGAEFWDTMLDAPAADWLTVQRNFGIALKDDDDPVPQAVVDVLYNSDNFDTQAVYEMLAKLPQRDTLTWKSRVAKARQELAVQLKEVWKQCLARLRFKLPLLVMDEAHHLKNADTQLAKLFHTADAENDANEVSRGALAGVFERMLFLTATPFQLGHHELCSVLERFDGIAWKSSRGPASGREAFQNRMVELRERLDAAQRATLNLEVAWGRLRPDDLVINGEVASSVDCWWDSVRNGDLQLPAASSVRSSFDVAARSMRAAEHVLRPFAVRHLRPRMFKGHPRRERLPGAAILSDSAGVGDRGIEVSGPALVPFLLAARATTCEPDKRPVFAEGLASSYEAFLHTRHPTEEEQKTGTVSVTDGEDSELAVNDGETSSVSAACVAAARDAVAGSAEWYLDQLERSLPLDDLAASASHPKIEATANRVLAAWRAGEKVLVFCHFKRTGRTLRQVISGLLHQEIERLAAEKVGCPQHEAGERLARYSQLFRRSHGDDSPARRAVNAEVEKLLEPFAELHTHRDSILKVCRRFIRTPSFLVRYFSLEHDWLDATAIEQAFANGGDSGLSLRAVLEGFFRFLTHQCEEVERQRYLEVILRTQTGAIHGDEALTSFSPDEAASSPTERLLPNVRLVNGESKQETRQRLMLTFNSPFFPEVLIASSVMAEGVDLHRFCRYVIHHDLCWNPSTLEQRTGRVDRIGAKVEQCGQPIQLYLPYLGETQDEKQYRVVMDRERWFSVVMGESFRTDARSTERLADRVPLPAALARELAFRLEAAEDREMSATLMT